jgi:uncharacterized membrane protein YphA (DoxX/SURF4 family)
MNSTDVSQCVACGKPLAAASSVSSVKRFLTSPCLSVFFRAVVGALFIIAGWVKTGTDFEGAIMQYGLLPLILVPTVAKVLPYVELIIGFCLLCGLLTRLSCVGTAAMLVIFIGAISIAWAQGKTYIECGCGLGKEYVGSKPIIRDLLMLLATIQVFFYDKRILSLDSWLAKK